MPERSPSRKEIAARTALFAVGAAIAILGAMEAWNHENSRLAYTVFALWGVALSLISLNRETSWELFNGEKPPLEENNKSTGKDQSISSN